jgi:DHA1 family quinolone resistance protein-like MFS transporter
MNTPPVRRIAPVLIYLLPALADLLVAQFLFVNAVRLAHAGASASVVANTVTVWSVAYLLACPVIGRFLTAANAARMMMGSMAGMAVIGALFTVMDGVVGVYILMALMGMIAALFFPPFQVFMKAVDRVDDKPLAYSTGLYTFSWSMGFAIGPFVAGFLMDLGPDGWKIACWFAVAVALAAAISVYYLKSLVHGQPLAPAAEPETIRAPVMDYSRMADLAWLGWVGGGVGVILITFVRAVFPVRAEAVLHLAQSTQGVIFFLVSLAQALTGLVLCRSRYWMYRPMAIMAFGLAGMLGLVAFGFGQTTLALVTGAVLFGVYTGSYFFYLVFHALVHPQRSSRYVAINESVVGVCSMAGAMIGGWVADRLGFGTLYAGGVLLLLVTLVFQWGIHRRHPVLSK